MKERFVMFCFLPVAPWGTMGHPLRGASPGVARGFAFAEVRCKKIIGNLGNLELVLKPLGRSEQSEQSEICAICLDAGPGFRKLQCILPADVCRSPRHSDRNWRNERIVRRILHNFAEVMTGDDRCFFWNLVQRWIDGVLRQVIMRSTWIASRRCRRAVCGLC